MFIFFFFFPPPPIFSGFFLKINYFPQINLIINHWLLGGFTTFSTFWPLEQHSFLKTGRLYLFHRLTTLASLNHRSSLAWLPDFLVFQVTIFPYTTIGSILCHFPFFLAILWHSALLISKKLKKARIFQVSPKQVLIILTYYHNNIFRITLPFKIYG